MNEEVAYLQLIPAHIDEQQPVDMLGCALHMLSPGAC